MNKILTKKNYGSASFYVVIISALLLGIIITSFSLLSIRERAKSAENNLAQSAYNSALAGVEDAKLALSEYYSCINTGSPVTEGYQCSVIEDLILQSSDELLNASGCSIDAITKILHRNGDDASGAIGGEVLIKETAGSDSSTVQAYTCVQVSPIAPNYKGTINQSSPVRTIPLYQAEHADEVHHIKVSWYSTANHSAHGNTSPTWLSTFIPSNTDTPIVPPILQFSFFQTDKQFGLNNLDLDKSANRGTVWLVPQDTGESTVTSNTLTQSYNHDSKNTPVKIKCSTAQEYFCTATITLPSLLLPAQRNADTFLATLSLPYDAPETDFSVELYDSANNPIRFKDAQIIVDSTGRANDIYSRVEARLEYRDVFFPIPEYAIDLSGDGSSTSLSKNLWFTINCWSLKNGEPTNICATEDSVARD